MDKKIEENKMWEEMQDFLKSLDDESFVIEYNRMFNTNLTMDDVIWLD